MPLLVAVRSGARDSMPGMMDTILNLGLNDQTVLALEPRPTTSASPGTATAASSRCTATSSWACRSAKARITSRSRPSSTFKHEKYHKDISTPKLTAEDQQELVKRFKAARQGAHRQGVPERPVGPAPRRRRRRVRLLDERPRDRLSPQIQHPRRVGHRRQRAGHGVRQHRRHLRLRRGLHPQPRQRRERILRRVPHQRPGRGRRRRRAHARARRSS
jgi:hypothetical protein